MNATHQPNPNQLRDGNDQPDPRHILALLGELRPEHASTLYEQALRLGEQQRRRDIEASLATLDLEQAANTQAADNERRQLAELTQRLTTAEQELAAVCEAKRNLSGINKPSAS